MLKDANYIPENKYCILSLRCWDADGRRYTAVNGNLTLYNVRNKPVMVGQKLNTHMYKVQLWPKTSMTSTAGYILLCMEPRQNWTTWHRRFGHVSL